MQFISTVIIQFVLLVLTSNSSCGIATTLLRKAGIAGGVTSQKRGEALAGSNQSLLANASNMNASSKANALPAFVGVVASPEAPASFLQDVFGVIMNDKFHDKRLVLLGRAAFFLLACLAICCAMASILLLACSIYDAMSAWRHRARFRACQKQVKRVHEAFHSKRGDLPLCPYCVEPISDQRSPKTVVFLCGHRFHVACSNRWFQEHPHVNTKCPICVSCETTDAICHSGDCAWQRECQPEVNDGALAFMLHSLRRKYPEIISEACVHRWVSCHTEIWLSELTCPRYNSILGKHHK